MMKVQAARNWCIYTALVVAGSLIGSVAVIEHPIVQVAIATVLS